ncbi:MAG: TldD/PmbA family protein [Deltaproteobacteria bacterium]|nr:TldD/PmbA family protein [Deltaproteobacteria bacterium]
MIPAVEWSRELAGALVDAAKRAGADAADAAVGLGAALSASARDGAVEEVTRSSWRAAGLRVIVGGRLGFATSADAPLDARSIRALADAAVGLARVSTPSDDNVLPPTVPDAGAKEREAALGTWDDATAELGPDWATAHALAMEAALRRVPGIAATKEVSAATRHGILAVATSGGFLGAQRGTSASLSCAAVVEDGARKQTERDWDAARAVAALRAPEEVARAAAVRALARVGARKLAAVRAPVLFDPSMARGFFGALLAGVSGDVVARRRSFLAELRGERVLPAGISVVDDPSLVRGLASRVFDGEGLATPKTFIVDEAGVLRAFLHDARSAHRLGEAPTGHAARGATSLPHPAPTNTLVLGGSGTLDDLIAATERGLLVTGLLGHGPDLVTGDYSRGAAGFWIEGGAIAFPVEEVTIAGRMLDLLRGIDRVAADAETRAALRAPSIRFAEMVIGGR